MKLIEAFSLIKKANARAGSGVPCFLAAGFNPLHLHTFLHAELCAAFPERRIDLRSGIFGDLTGNLDRLRSANPEFGAVFIEWPDLDPRLGIRSSARWKDNELSDILRTAQGRSEEIQASIERTSTEVPLLVCLPTLRIPPISSSPISQAGAFEFDLRSVTLSLGSALSRNSRVRILSVQMLDSISPPGERHDIEAELLTGFPYRLFHASALASTVARLAANPTRKKGLITDLDDTLWRGIAGEDDIGQKLYDSHHHTQLHAFYQRFLGALAGEGVLIGAATKNDPETAATAMQRTDLALPSSAIFPIEATWKPKSQSVARILERWNIGAGSVVFVDDNVLELAEMQRAYPEMECLQFPTSDGEALYKLIVRLRDLFGKAFLLEEDTIRTQSLRKPNPKTNDSSEPDTPNYLGDLHAEITFNFAKSPPDPRAFELVSKVNQFNLNGRRCSERAWHASLLEPEAYFLMASYRDRFGPLGQVAVMAGSMRGRTLIVSTWVMSCRAFSRQIEYRCLSKMLEQCEAEEVQFAYKETGKNKPFSEALKNLLEGDPYPDCTIPRGFLEERLREILELREVVNG